MEQTITFLCSFFCEKQGNLLDFFRRCFLALVFFLSGNFFVKATLRNWKKKNCWMVTVTFFFVSCPTKHLFDIQRLDSAFLKYSFAPARLMGSDKPCWSRLFYDHLFELQAASGRVLLPKKKIWLKFCFAEIEIERAERKTVSEFSLLGKQETRSVRYVKQQNNLVTLLMVSFLVSFSLPIKKKPACKVSEVSDMLHLSA